MMLASGTLLGRYRLQNLIGSGSTGEVYLAEEVRNGRQVAFKVLRIELPPDGVDESVQLFRRDAAQIADLQHAHILPLLDFGDVVVDDAVLFYTVMQQHKGGTLDTWLQERGPSACLSPADVVMLLQPIADALDYAHDQQVVHQAIRPTNLLVRACSNSALPDLLLTDFSFVSLHLTIPDPPGYVAPEQWAGTPIAATDQYSLAAIAYRLLTGNTPFQGTPEQVKQQQLNAIPQHVSESLAQLHTDMDPVLLMALAKEPQRRFTSVGAFIHALQQAVQQHELSESVTLSAQPILASAQRPSISGPLEQTVLPQPISPDSDNAQQVLTHAQLQSPMPSTTPAASAKKVATPVLRRDSALMNILSLLFLTIIITASSLGILVKRQHDQPGIDATATADIKSQNSDISNYIAGQKRGDLLVYDPLSNTRTHWTSRDSLGTCDIVSLSKALKVTTASTPPLGVTSQSEERFHSCSTTDYNQSSTSNASLPKNVIIEVQVRFDRQTSIGGIIFSQIESDQSEKFFVFSISLDGRYDFCLLASLNQTCSGAHVDGPFSTAVIRASEGFNRIAVVIIDNVYHLYLNEKPLLQEGIQVEQGGIPQVVAINNVGVVTGVVPSVEDPRRSEYAELWYRDLKIWKV